MLAAIFSGVNLLAISPNGDDFCGSGPLRGDDADVPGETHDIGMHLRRLLGRPWLCTGSNSKDLLSVAHAMVLLLTVVAHRVCRLRLTPSRSGRGPEETGERREVREGNETEGESTGIKGSGADDLAQSDTGSGATRENNDFGRLMDILRDG